MDAATDFGGRAKPTPGDFCVCFHCNHIMAFTEKLRLRNLTDTEIFRIAGDPKLLRLTYAVGELMKYRARA